MDQIPTNLWSSLPYPALTNIFQYLNFKDLIAASEVCRDWYEASRSPLLWKDLFYSNFRVDRSVQKISGKLNEKV